MLKFPRVVLPLIDPSKRRQKGYSLLELLVVLAIIGMLVTIVGPRLFNQVDKGKVTAAHAQARSLKTSLDALSLDLGRYPTDDEGLSLLMQPPSDSGLASLWDGPYLDSAKDALPTDPWGNSFFYKAPVRNTDGRRSRARIISYGADGEPGGDGADADIEV